MEFRFTYKELPTMMSKYSKAGKAFIPYSKQSLPKISPFSMTRHSLAPTNDYETSPLSKGRNCSVIGKNLFFNFNI